MHPSNFEQSNAVLDTPRGMSVDQVEPLFAYRGECGDGTPVVISCWRPTAEELAEIQRTGRVWLMVLGATMPPAVLLGTDPWAGRESDG